ncbi:uncharacterized protein EKO05_0002591 [Ascochyta rabiei]|uniref:uncharacterized protein n=1 Tax=Didymella rabiei TaxID=5454 RepID=UPI00220A6AA2|nr:uncharacterized protein EKO05_0002591 [Ascochyta rabiei]UPX12013.1 hypothetical protein EKO05_0002591 [Ascochyta rabiei]
MPLRRMPRKTWRRLIKAERHRLWGMRSCRRPTHEPEIVSFRFVDKKEKASGYVRQRLWSVCCPGWFSMSSCGGWTERAGHGGVAQAGSHGPEGDHAVGGDVGYDAALGPNSLRLVMLRRRRQVPCAGFEEVD